MILIAHRRNTARMLAETPTAYGIEMDIRSEGPRLIVQHDPRIHLAIVAAIIIGREITVSALREWMSGIGASTKVAVSFVAKWKTTVQIVGISMMLYQENIGPIPIYRTGEILLFIAAALTVLSMLDYLRSAWPTLRDGG